MDAAATELFGEPQGTNAVPMERSRRNTWPLPPLWAAGRNRTF
jgi:hypothetical protein